MKFPFFPHDHASHQPSSPPTFQPAPYHYPCIFARAGTLPATERTASHRLRCTVATQGEIDRLGTAIPAIASDPGAVQRLPIQIPDDRLVWADLLRYPPTHIVTIGYEPFNARFKPKFLLNHSFNFQLATRTPTDVAGQVCKFLEFALLKESNVKTLLHSDETIKYGFWLLAVKAKYRDLWYADRSTLAEWQ